MQQGRVFKHLWGNKDRPSPSGKKDNLRYLWSTTQENGKLTSTGPTPTKEATKKELVHKVLSNMRRPS